MDDRPEPLDNFKDPDEKPLYPDSHQDSEILQQFDRIFREVEQRTAKRAEVEALVRVMDKHPAHFQTKVAARKVRCYLK